MSSGEWKSGKTNKNLQKIEKIFPKCSDNKKIKCYNISICPKSNRKEWKNMDFKNLENFMDKITAWRIPGAECEVYLENKRVFRYTSGYADVDKKTPIDGSKYFLYSVTKPATAAAVMQLVERGEILLCNPVKEYLPEFSEMYVKREIEPGKFELKKAEHDITIKHLLSMSAGFDYNWDTPAIQSVKAASGGVSPTREIVRAIAQSPLWFEPGEHWQYSLCLDVLGGLVEAVSGMKFGEYVKKNIFEPIGMENSTFRFTEEIESQMASQYRFDEELGRYKKIDFINPHSNGIGSEYDSGGAGIISTVEDYAKFASALANGGVAPNGSRILSSGAVELMRTNMLSAEALKDVTWESIYGYGYGAAVRTMIDRTKCSSIGSVGEFGWGGAAGAYLMADPEKKLSVFYAQHMLNSQEPYVHPRLRNIVYSSIEY